MMVDAQTAGLLDAFVSALHKSRYSGAVIRDGISDTLGLAFGTC